ncbi:MAG: S9 family peptidase, partial [Hyphomicrobiaceae bacterium]|nr:S9 family peptidase [Hyphomicrobiaceae bacterium]
MTSRTTPPIAKKTPVTSTWHGITLVDDYAWLKADNWQEAVRDPSVLPAEIRAHLEAENAHVAGVMAHTEELQAKLFAEMKGRIKEDDSSVPSPDGAWDYFSSYVTGGQYPRICRRPRGGGEETLLLDGNAEAEGRAYWRLGGDDHSPDHRLLAYATDTNGSEYFTIRVRDLATGKDLSDEIPHSDGSMVWSRDSSAFYYMRLDDNHRPRQLFRHVLGTQVSDDVLVYEEETLGHYVHVSETQSRDFLVIDVTDHENSEVHLLDASSSDPKPRLVVPRREKHLYSVEHHGDLLYILTNSGDAEDFRIVTAPIATPDEAHWRELVPHRPGTLILGLTMYKDFMVRLERENSLPRIVIRDLANGQEHTIAFDEEAYSLGLGGGYEFDTTTLRFSYSSMTTPSQVFDYDMRTRKRTLRKTQEVPSGHDPADYVTRRLFAPAPDGELVPISLLYHKSTTIDGSAPLFLYGYGSYGYSIPASFSTGRLSLVDRGFVFAIAHIRGGKDKGFRWYTDGKLAKKMNTFTDFIACGEHLVREGFTTRGNIVANGGSAGGLLMGAVANLAPDLFCGVIADVPFVDALNTMLDINLPLTPREFPEWGNPI